jgi:hypothetical protein
MFLLVLEGSVRFLSKVKNNIFKVGNLLSILGGYSFPLGKGGQLGLGSECLKVFFTHEFIDIE